MTRLIQFVFRIILFFDTRFLTQGSKESLNRKEIKRILLVNTTAMGDTLLSTPAIRAVRKEFSEAYIASLVHVKQKDVLKNNPRINELVIYSGKYRGLLRLIRRLRKKKFDLVIVLHANDPDIVPIIYLTGARYRVGWAESKFSFLFTHTFKRPENKILHTIDQRFGILESIGIVSDSVEMEYFFNEKEIRFSDNFLKRNNISENDILIGLHPFGSLESKAWPNYIDFIEKISKEDRFKLVLIGGKKHEREVFENRSKIGNKIISAVGKTYVGETAAIVIDG